VNEGGRASRGAAIGSPANRLAEPQGWRDQPETNPKSFVLPPGEFQVEVSEIKGERRTVNATVGAGETVERTVDLDAP
jgi:hypothetical protein